MQGSGDPEICTKTGQLLLSTRDAIEVDQLTDYNSRYRSAFAFYTIQLCAAVLC